MLTLPTPPNSSGGAETVTKSYSSWQRAVIPRGPAAPANRRRVSAKMARLARCSPARSLGLARCAGSCRPFAGTGATVPKGTDRAHRRVAEDAHPPVLRVLLGKRHLPEAEGGRVGQREAELVGHLSMLQIPATTFCCGLVNHHRRTPNAAPEVPTQIPLSHANFVPPPIASAELVHILGL